MYNQETADKVCELLASGLSLRKSCEGLDTSPQSILRWVQSVPEFAEQYARARELGYMLLADEIQDISDSGTKAVIQNPDGTFSVNPEAIQRDRLRVDTRKWILSKMLPKVYGDKLDVTSKDQQIGFTVADAVAIAQAKAKQRTEDSAG